MYFDRIKLQINLKKEYKIEKIKEIEQKIIKNGEYKYFSNSFKNFYLIKKSFFNFYYYNKTKILIIDFNICKYFGGINFGEYTEKDTLKVINILNKYINTTFNIDIEIKQWNVNYIELKKDIKYKNEKEKNRILNVYKRCCKKGNLKNYKYETSCYRRNKNTKVCIYDKENELKSRITTWDKMDEYQKEEVKNTLRFEMAVNGNKLNKIMGFTTKFKNILCIKTQEKIYNSFFLKMGFEVGKIQTRIALLNRIRDLEMGKIQKKNLIKFIKEINENFENAKKRYKSFYVYLKIMKENELSCFYVDDEEFLREIIENNKTAIGISTNINIGNIYNICTVFNNAFFNMYDKLE